MTTKRIPTGSSSASDSDHNRSIDGFRIDEDGLRINEADYLALENIVMDWGRYQRDEWWSKAKRMIDVDEDGCVRKLECPDRIKSLHPSIGRLRSLEELDLGYTNELASLPEEIRINEADYLALENIVMDWGHYQRDEWWPEAKRVIQVDEDGCVRHFQCPGGVASLHPSIGRLQSLKELNLGCTSELTSLPEEIGDLGSLIKLSLYGSAIRSLPPSIGRLQSLDELNLGCTSELTSLPEEIGNLGSLT
eukprot:CAMPEP_0197283050 /NCGR_PEP_ID=MMETSP1432-20130617/24734_1 /TAXON_ID=44447 /ORGANISM="Pseudo-nitzschia delicatissima, Strain UNC1205" /LENGTH=248 /DNA_ID=CAMNT_0042750033 /DNA_START=99 /DNA_END=845 /DNA_ORIENTATION=-